MDLTSVGGTAVFAYLLGSFPAAYLVARLVAGVDIRMEGEGNAGARNVFHIVGPAWGLVVFGLDFGKGAAVALPLRHRSAWLLAIAGIFLVIGHAYPLWLRFVGGKGLAAAGGFGAALMPLPAVVAGTVGGAMWIVKRRFLPTLIPAAVAFFVAAPLLSVDLGVVTAVLAAFVTVALKRVLDEPRMRRIEAETGWDRVHGGVA